MLSRLRVKNFRLLRDVEITFPQGKPVVLVGPNASGKSTVLEVLDFLSRCAEDGLQDAVGAHGGFDALRTAGVTDPVEIACEWRFSRWNEDSPAVRTPSVLQWSFALQGSRGGQVDVVREAVRDRARELIAVSTNDEGVRQVHPEGGSGPERRSVFKGSQLAHEQFVDPIRFDTLGSLTQLTSGVQVLGALPTAPNWARDDNQTTSPRDSMVIAPRSHLSRQGFGLATMLYNLQAEHETEWSLLQTAFRGEFPFVRRIVFPVDAGGAKISFAIEDERFPKRKIHAAEMSDGMIAYLCLLTGVLNPDHLGALGLDEPDSHLHPSALRRFMSLVQRQNGQRNIILVTHSNALLDEIADPAASIRIVEAGPNGTTIRQLDPAALEAWRGEYTLSAMRQTGLLDRANTDVAEAE